MSELDEILNQVPISQLASQWGVDESEIKAATRSALPALLGGLQANASDPSGADSIVSALSNHTSTVRGLDDIDENDGQKIVGNIFGGQQDQVVSQLGGHGGSSSSIISKLMPILAPIVMSWLARKMGGAGGSGADGAGAGGGLGGILGGMLGGGAPAGASANAPDTEALFPGGVGAGSEPTQNPSDGLQPAGGANEPGAAPATGGAAGSLQDILGSVLGGAAGGGSGGSDILGGLLGGLLGGGKR
ncbi:MAG: DUF937 domain-containing protein [Humibacillus sp.]|nr:DUF937 domain-containing protein [Humibacillus sp.]MDN5777013.1 DUF937 domain-containing protein [Humibacillus sp.]